MSIGEKVYDDERNGWNCWLGTYFPEAVQTAADLVEVTGIPEAVLREKMGIRQRHIASDEETVT